MDKRYLLILLIIIMCSINLYILADNSEIVGSANIESKNFIFSIPEGFTLYESTNQYVCLFNQNNGIYTYVYLNLTGDDIYQKRFDELNKSKDTEILSNGVIKHKNIDINSIYYSKEGKNHSIFIFTKDNYQFSAHMLGFNYDTQKNETISIISEIVDTIRINYKRMDK